jgi:hypothetical protein
MSDDNHKVDISDNLDEFEAQFFGQEPEQQEPVAEEVETEEVEEEVDEVEENPLATDEDDEEAEEEEDEEQDEEEPEPEPKPKAKSKVQLRIEKLLERERLANERANALEQRLAALEAGKEEKADKEPTLREQLSADAPHPDAKDKDGEPLYPLGEFDPQFISDLTRHTIEQEMKAQKEREQQEAQAKEIEASRQAVADAWVEKLDKYEEEVPEVRESIKELTDTFQNIEPAYGEYLATTIMASDFGPQIMHYLSQNIGEAQKIVASGPAAATLALGRLEARFISPKQEGTRRNKKVSDAPAPPENRTRGHGGKFAVSPDTDDLDAFERVFFDK